MTVLSAIFINHPLEVVDRFERDNPELMDEIFQVARKYALNHKRVATGDQVLDLEEYATAEDYHAFLAEAADANARYEQLLGPPASTDVLYEVVRTTGPGDVPDYPEDDAPRD